MLSSAAGSGKVAHFRRGTGVAKGPMPAATWFREGCVGGSQDGCDDLKAQK
ncbi:MAG TPA: hypothetical protein VMD92_13040 [Acidobacteriaceae bacterium]|nr:hypothetical protein [Acidobacteriaceae bacterium]